MLPRTCAPRTWVYIGREIWRVAQSPKSFLGELGLQMLRGLASGPRDTHSPGEGPRGGGLD